ncbi:MAG TPA: alpha/beta fold hydrolase, partial [Solirubrobacteraceae bacterium]|nr:alpha/beta fold hydrolase [Solirubrobacteraceae bacterium]
RPLALDLPGHGESSSHGRPISFEGCVEQVLAAAPKRFVLCGYSMGGRIALRAALAAPDRVQRLVLVSSTAGIEDAAARHGRSVADRELAERLESIPFEEFIERWRTQPLFADEPPQVGALARDDHRRNRPEALAAALRGIGTGEMGSLWDRLGELTMPVQFVVGERDAKFRALATRMCTLVRHGEIDVVPGGHVVPLESPDALARVLQRP